MTMTKVLNLVNKETSHIKYEVSFFPDGQKDIKIEPSTINEDDAIRLVGRLNSFSDLELIVCAVKALRRIEVKDIYLYIPYLLGSRSDRDFTEGKGGTSYLVDVVAPILNGLNCTTITTVDAHSDVAAACIPNLKVIDNNFLMRKVLDDLYGPNSPDNFNLVSPDGGALKKIHNTADKIGFTGDIITCSKYRDWHGKLSRIEVPVRVIHLDKDFLIIDDICDGGRTFTEIAKHIREAQKTASKTTGKIYLVVTHGIFSAGIEPLRAVLDGIYCSNSYSDVAEEHQDFVKQVNVF